MTSDAASEKSRKRSAPLLVYGMIGCVLVAAAILKAIHPEDFLGAIRASFDVEATLALTIGAVTPCCAMSQATMVQGIKAAIVETIPEITDVVDATDHAAGENPFYT